MNAICGEHTIPLPLSYAPFLTRQIPVPYVTPLEHEIGCVRDEVNRTSSLQYELSHGQLSLLDISRPSCCCWRLSTCKVLW
jgi:hypothetical protein